MGWVRRGKGDLAVEDEQDVLRRRERYFRYRERVNKGAAIWKQVASGGTAAGENGDA